MQILSTYSTVLSFYWRFRHYFCSNPRLIIEVLLYLVCYMLAIFFKFVLLLKSLSHPLQVYQLHIWYTTNIPAIELKNK